MYRRFCYETSNFPEYDNSYVRIRKEEPKIDKSGHDNRGVTAPSFCLIAKSVVGCVRSVGFFI
jgi:hypothetical protein